MGNGRPRWPLSRRKSIGIDLITVAGRIYASFIAPTRHPGVTGASELHLSTPPPFLHGTPLSASWLPLTLCGKQRGRRGTHFVRTYPLIPNLVTRRSSITTGLEMTPTRSRASDRHCRNSRLVSIHTVLMFGQPIRKQLIITERRIYQPQRNQPWTNHHLTIARNLQ